MNTNTNAPVRVGILGCAKVVGWGLMDHIALLPEIEVVNISSRDPAKAIATAQQYGIPRTSTYEGLLQDPEVDLIYNPLPNNLHMEWTIRALEAGKPVLCEKPIAINVAEAEQMAAVAAKTGLPLIEAVHYRYHPLARRITEVVRSGVLGPIRRIEVRLLVKAGFFSADDIRYDAKLGGGATMDPGCYCVNMSRLITGEEPRVTAAHSILRSPDLDVRTDATLEFPSGCVAEIAMSMEHTDNEFRLIVHGDKGVLDIQNPLAPHWGHEWKLTVDGKTQTEDFGTVPTFVYQYQDVAKVLREGKPILTDVNDAIANMRVVESIYKVAGLPPRG